MSHMNEDTTICIRQAMSRTGKCTRQREQQGQRPTDDERLGILGQQKGDPEQERMM